MFSDNSFIITLDDSSVIYADLKIHESFAPVIKRNLPVNVKFSGLKNKLFSGKVEGYSSRISADTRSLLTRIKINNKDFVYRVLDDNSLEKTQIQIGNRDEGFIEVISGLNEGDLIVAEGLKKVNPKGKIKPIKK